MFGGVKALFDEALKLSLGVLRIFAAPSHRRCGAKCVSGAQRVAHRGTFEGVIGEPSGVLSGLSAQKVWKCLALSTVLSKSF